MFTLTFSCCLKTEIPLPEMILEMKTIPQLGVDKVVHTVVLGIEYIPVCVGATDIDRFRFGCMIESIFFSLSQKFVLIYICIKMQSNKMNRMMQYLLNNIALFIQCMTSIDPRGCPFQ